MIEKHAKIEFVMRPYVALIHKDPESAFGVSFPDLPGCVSAGSSVEEARQMAAEALALHLGGLLEDGEPAPVPSSLEEVMKRPESKVAVAVVIECSDP